MIHDMIGGGVAFNFKVVGNPKPSNPKLNTIWVNTDTPITGWIFNAAQPETAAEGTVLLYTARGGTISFNALKKNNITVYPTSAKQYIGGAWVQKPAEIWQDDKWHEFATWLYINGNECKGLTGGWQARGWGWSTSQTTAANMSVVNEEERLAITASGGGLVSGVGEIVEDYDLTNVSTLTIDYELVGENFLVYLMVIPRNSRYLGTYTEGIELGGHSGAVAVPRQTRTLDVSALTGTYDIAIGFNTSWASEKSMTAYMYGLRAD